LLSSLEKNNFSIMISRELGDKSETQQGLAKL
jgi:hypothetical protein